MFGSTLFWIQRYQTLDIALWSYSVCFRSFVLTMWSDLDDRTMNKSLIQSFLHHRMSGTHIWRSGPVAVLILHSMYYCISQSGLQPAALWQVQSLCSRRTLWLTRPASEPSEPQNIIRTANRCQRETRESIKSPESPFIVRGPAEYHFQQI